MQSRRQRSTVGMGFLGRGSWEEDVSPRGSGERCMFSCSCGLRTKTLNDDELGALGGRITPYFHVTGYMVLHGECKIMDE